MCGPVCVTCCLLSVVFALAMDKTKTHRLSSWNVRDLNDTTKCGDVLAELLPQHLTFLVIQETKLATFDRTKLRSFLPSHLTTYDTVAATGASGGILSAWDPTSFALTSSTKRSFSLTTDLCSSSDGT